VLDTRDPQLGGAAGKIGAGRTLRLDLGDAVPGGASAAALSVTGVDTCAGGYVTAFDCATLPATSNVNLQVGRTTAALVIAPLDDGATCLYSSQATDLVVDVTGAFVASGQGFHPLAPTRLVDTRAGQPALFSGIRGQRTTGDGIEIDLAGAAGVPANATAVWLNLTIADPVVSTVLLASPGRCGSTPVASTVNARPARSAAVATLVGLSDGTVCVHTVSGLSDVVVDVTGWFGSSGLRYVPSEPERLVDTRSASAVPAQGTVQVDVDAVDVVNVTATGATTAGFVAVRTCNTTQTSSALNIVAGEDIANVTVADGTAGAAGVCASPSVTSQLVVDRVGSFVGS
jgi:hypothetical protein